MNAITAGVINCKYVSYESADTFHTVRMVMIFTVPYADGINTDRHCSHQFPENPYTHAEP